jgi:hypothetical protein
MIGFKKKFTDKIRESCNSESVTFPGILEITTIRTVFVTVILEEFDDETI